MSHPYNSPPFNIFNNIAVSGSTSSGAAFFTSSASSILARQLATYQINVIGSTQGFININVSNDYNPQLPQSTNPFNSSTNGNWTTLCSTSVPGLGGSPINFDITINGNAWIQAQYVSSTASGTISGWYVAKSMG